MIFLKKLEKNTDYARKSPKSINRTLGICNGFWKNCEEFREEKMSAAGAEIIKLAERSLR